MMEHVITSAKEYAKTVFAADSSGHDFHHTLRVHALARSIALAEGADVAIVELAALLHDVDDHKLSPETADTKQNAVDFLRSHDFSAEKIQRIVHIIEQVSFSKNTLPPDSLEAMCVQDADRMDAIGAIGIARTFAFGGSHGRAIFDPEGDNSGSSIAHFHEKLLKLRDRMNTSTGKAMALHRHEYLEQFLEEFHKEWLGLL